MSKKFYTKKEFCKLAGINNDSRLNQIIKGWNNHGYVTPPALVEGKDFVVTGGYIFFESALKKLA